MRLFPKLILSVLALVLSADVAAVSPQAQQAPSGTRQQFPGLAAQSTTGTVHVDACAPGPGDGSQFNPYNTVTRAVDEAPPGSTLVIQAGSYPERLTIPTIPKNLTITASGGPVLIGEYFVGTQEICVPVAEQEGQFSDAQLVNCARANDPFKEGVHAKLYYPATAPGDAPVACGGPFPLIVYAHGRRLKDWDLCDWSNPGPIHEDYREADRILTRLAASGIIVISVDVSWGFNDEVAKAAIILNTLAFARDENARLGSRLRGAVDMGQVGLAGHSTGGEAAIRVAACLQRNCFTEINLPEVRVSAVGLLAPGFPATVKVADMGVPALVIHGTNEHPKQVGDNPLEIYGLAKPPKHLVVVTGANHFGYTDGICLDPNDGFDNPSQVGGVTGQEARSRQQQTARNYVRAFFSHYLRGDATQLDFLLQQSGEQCFHPGNPPTCGSPRRRFDELDRLNVQVSVCSCVR